MSADRSIYNLKKLMNIVPRSETETIEAIEEAIEALRLITPTRPDYYEERDTGEGGYGGLIFYEVTCPYCGLEVEESDVICSNCGQRLDWSEENE